MYAILLAVCDLELRTTSLPGDDEKEYEPLAKHRDSIGVL